MTMPQPLTRELTPPTGFSPADLVIQHLALSEAELQERIRDAEADRALFREVVIEALHVLHALTVENARLCDRVRDLLTVTSRYTAAACRPDRERAA